MYGVAIGDLLGSKYEFRNIKTKDFELFQKDMFITDDTVMTCAVMESLLDNVDIRQSIIKWFHRYPRESYGVHFANWVLSGCKELQFSMGNGSAMRVSPVGMWARNEQEVKALSRKVTYPSHCHPDGLKGAEATAMMVFLARHNMGRFKLEDRFRKYYPKRVNLDKVRADMEYWGAVCYNTVPQAMQCFFESVGFEDCMRNCISIGGDSDTIGAIAGGVAEAYYCIPEPFLVKLGKFMPEDIADVFERFYNACEKRYR